MRGWRLFSVALLLLGGACSDDGASEFEGKDEGSNGEALEVSVPGATVLTMEHGAITREYIVYTPTTYDGAVDLPLMLLFHGNGGNASDFMNETAMTDLADAANVLLVYPQGSLLEGSSHWNPSPLGEGNKSSTDDLSFIAALLDALVADYSVDESRVYAAGYSNGAFMSYGLVCSLSERFAAVGGVSGTMLGGTEACEPTHPIPVIALRGTEDPVVPFGGGPGYPSSDEVVAFWTSFNGITTEPTLTTDGQVERALYEGGESGVAVVRYKVNGGDHVWFDLDFEGADTGQLIWDFVSQYDLNGAR